MKRRRSSALNTRATKRVRTLRTPCLFLDLLVSDCRSVIRRFLPWRDRGHLKWTCHALAAEDTNFPARLYRDDVRLLRSLAVYSQCGIPEYGNDPRGNGWGGALINPIAPYDPAGALFDQHIWPYCRYFYYAATKHFPGGERWPMFALLWMVDAMLLFRGQWFVVAVDWRQRDTICGIISDAPAAWFAGREK